MAVGHPPTGLTPLAWRPTTQANHLPAAAEVRAALRSILATRGNIQHQADWISRVTVQQLYQSSKQLARFVLLAAHEDRIADQANPGLIERGVARAFTCLTPAAWRADYSVEHIAPQSLATGDTSYEHAIYDQGLPDRLGNLTLMPEDLNQFVGNRTWPFKRDIYNVLSMTDLKARVTEMQRRLNGLAPKTKSVLESTQYLPFCEFIADQKAAVLPSPFLIQRGQRLAELAVARLWPMLA